MKHFFTSLSIQVQIRLLLIGFVLLYLLAAFLYPGGHFLNENHAGMHWGYNFYCDLMDDPALNGHLNTSRWVAIGSLICLSAAIVLHFYRLVPVKHEITRRSVVSLTIVSMVSLMMMEYWHDDASTIATISGILASVTTLFLLIQIRQYVQSLLLFLTVVLVVLNWAMWITATYLEWLPTVQKATLLYGVIWMALRR